jgi:hypothetical protein
LTENENAEEEGSKFGHQKWLYPGILPNISNYRPSQLWIIENMFLFQHSYEMIASSTLLRDLSSGHIMDSLRWWNMSRTDFLNAKWGILCPLLRKHSVVARNDEPQKALRCERHKRLALLGCPPICYSLASATTVPSCSPRCVFAGLPTQHLFI